MEDYGLPKYIQLKKVIIGNINDEEYLIGELIPSERELMAKFDVSRITVRKAIEELVQEGYLYKVHGKGTYVKDDTNIYDLISITSCSQDVKRLGMIPTKKVILKTIEVADKKRQRLLNLGKGESVFSLNRIQYADGDPINYTLAHLPYKLMKGIEQYDFSQTSLYAILESAYGIEVTRAERTIEAIIASDEIEEYLEIEKGAPLILFKCTTYGVISGKEYPIETFKSYYRTDKFKFYINQVQSVK